MSPDPATHPTAVDPLRLVELLRAAGWTKAGGRVGLYARLAWPARFGKRDRSLVIPLDRAFADYEDLLTSALTELDDAARVGRAAAAVLDALGGPLATREDDDHG
jgi:hypothetical protein